MSQKLRNSPRKTELGDLELKEQPLSSRGKQTPGVPGFYGPGVPEGAALPAFQFFTQEDAEKLKAFTPDQANELARIIEKGLQSAFDRYSIYTQAKPFDDYNIGIVTCGAGVVTRLDGPAVAQGMPSRRALLIINPNVVAANVLWINRSSNFVATQGIPVPANNASYLVSIHERAAHWGLIAAQTNVVVVWYA